MMYGDEGRRNTTWIKETSSAQSLCHRVLLVGTYLHYTQCWSSSSHRLSHPSTNHLLPLPPSTPTYIFIIFVHGAFCFSRSILKSPRKIVSCHKVEREGRGGEGYVVAEKAHRSSVDDYPVVGVFECKWEHKCREQSKTEAWLSAVDGQQRLEVSLQSLHIYNHDAEHGRNRTVNRKRTVLFVNKNKQTNKQNLHVSQLFFFWRYGNFGNASVSAIYRRFTQSGCSLNRRSFKSFK